MSTPLLSVSITNYNYAQYVGRAIESVLRQSFQDLELIIVDNASTDNSVEIIREYMASDSRIRLVVNEVNRGLAYSLARAAELARGTYFVHIDADDWALDERAFELQLAVLERDPSISFVYSPLVLCDHADTRHVLPPPGYSEDCVVPGEQAILNVFKIYVVNSGPMMRMSSFRAVGGYNTSFITAIDIKLAMDLCTQGAVGYIHRPLYAFFQHQRSLSTTLSVTDKQLDMVRAVESAFQGPFKAKLDKKTRLEALGHILTLHATQFIFNDDYKNGLRALGSGLRINPAAVILKGNLPALALRVLGGTHGYKVISGLKWKLKGLLARNKKAQAQ